MGIFTRTRIETRLPQRKRDKRVTKEGFRMSKKNADKLAATKKWLERNSDIGNSIRPAQAALANAEKYAAESAAAKAKLSEAEKNKKKSFAALKDAVEIAKREKKLKNRGAKIQAKLATLAPGS
jgi:hypothetical protein